MNLMLSFYVLLLKINLHWSEEVSFNSWYMLFDFKRYLKVWNSLILIEVHQIIRQRE